MAAALRTVAKAKADAFSPLAAIRGHGQQPRDAAKIYHIAIMKLCQTDLDFA